MIQRVSVQIEVMQTRVDGTAIEGSAVVLIPMHGGEPLKAEISDRKHYRDERAIAAALRRLAKQIERGCYFEQHRAGRYTTEVG